MKAVVRSIMTDNRKLWFVIWHEPDFKPHFQMKSFPTFNEARAFADELREIPG